MPRKTRRRMVGGKQEDAERREREEQLRDLARELRGEQINRCTATDTSDEATNE
ncbi:MAG: hypothetical protein ACREGD_03920 [Candidatus Saccharimonadales bacterium]